MEEIVFHFRLSCPITKLGDHNSACLTSMAAFMSCAHLVLIGQYLREFQGYAMSGLIFIRTQSIL
jgi:hypothetical protein